MVDNTPSIDNGMSMVDNALPIDNGLSLIREEAQARRAGFNNATMRRTKQAKPHIAKIGGYWRVSPWKRGTGTLYYKAHAYAMRLNRLAKPIESNHPQDNPQQANQQRELLAKKLEHALAWNAGPATLLRILEAQVECERQATHQPIEEK